jgi:serine/threonine-protein kinase
MQKYLQKVPNTGFKKPPRRIDVGKQVRVPDLPRSYSAAKRKLERAGFTVERRFVYSDSVPRGSLVGWSPRPGSSVSEFGTVYAQFSRGPEPDEDEDEEEEEEEEKKKKEKEEDDE